MSRHAPADLIEASIGDVRLRVVGVLPQLPTPLGPDVAARARWVAPWADRVRGHGRLGPPLAGRALAADPAPAWPTTLRSWVLAEGSHDEPHDGPHGVLSGGLRDVVGGAAAPVLFEARGYDVYLEWPARGGAADATEARDVSLATDAPGLLSPRARFNDGARRLRHYRLEIGNEVGVLALRVVVSGTDVGVLEIEVFPRKLDYHRDYAALLADLAAIAPALAFEAAGRTARATGVGAGPGGTAAAWYELLRGAARDLFAAVDAIGRDPQRRLAPAPRWVDADRARRVRSGDVERALRVPGNVRDGAGTGPRPAKVWERTAVPDFDAEGNRHVRRLLGDVLVRLGQAERAVRAPNTTWTTTEGGRAVAARWTDEVAILRPLVQRRLAYEWVAAAGPHRGAEPSPSLQAHPLYARALGLGRALLRGLDPDAARMADAATRPVSQLYEYWCFLAIVEQLRAFGTLEQLHGPGRGPQFVARGSGLALRAGRAGAVTFRHHPSGRRLVVFFNRSYPSPTGRQRPDAAIHVESARGIHIFDAKYRFQFDRAYVTRRGGVGPRVADVSTMHRYRDAIVRRDAAGAYRRRVSTACVLFPGADAAKYRDHTFFASLHEIGVGGLPFLPSCTELVRERLALAIDEAVGRRGFAMLPA